MFQASVRWGCRFRVDCQAYNACGAILVLLLRVLLPLFRLKLGVGRCWGLGVLASKTYLWQEECIEIPDEEDEGEYGEDQPDESAEADLGNKVEAPESKFQGSLWKAISPHHRLHPARKFEDAAGISQVILRSPIRPRSRATSVQVGSTPCVRHPALPASPPGSSQRIGGPKLDMAGWGRFLQGLSMDFIPMGVRTQSPKVTLTEIFSIRCGGWGVNQLRKSQAPKHTSCALKTRPCSR